MAQSITYFGADNAGQLALVRALRFDFGRYNELIQALQVGVSVDAYSKKIEIMAPQDARGSAAVEPKRLFFQGHIAFVFGRRK